jgi:hypothetical protein
MIARAIDEAAKAIRDKRRRVIECLALGALCSLLAWAALGGSPRLALALAVGAGVEILLALFAFASRRGLISRLALEPDAYAIPEVESYGKALTQPRYRAQLAEGIRSMVRDAFRPGNLYLGHRVARYRRELEALARDLISPAVRVHPVSVARCRRLLTEAAESPLYNPQLPEEELAVILRRIRAGMQRDADNPE